MRHEGEPSVEEILESIKKVIARDNREAQQIERRRREGAGIALETAARDAGEETEEEVLDLGEELIDSRSTQTEGLTTDSVARSMRESLEALAMIAEPGAAPQIVRSGETSLEGLVRDMLRPMLADWLERNLPDMVERMVTAEIARIAGKRG